MKLIFNTPFRRAGWIIQYGASLLVNAFFLHLLLLGPGILMTLYPAMMVSIVWGLPLVGVFGHGTFSPWAFSHLMDPSSKWAFAPLTTPRKSSEENSSANREPASEGPEELTQKIDDLKEILTSTMGNIDETGIEMIGTLSQELAQKGSVTQLERFGVLVAPRVFNFNKPMAEAAQVAIPLVLNALNKQSPEKISARAKIIAQLSISPMNKWEEILWELKLINNLPVSEVGPLLSGIVANADLRNIKSDSKMGKRMEHVAEELQLQVGILLTRLEPSSPLFSTIRVLVKLLPRENDLYSAWSLVAHIDDVLLQSKFSHIIRERIHGSFSNEDYDLTVAYRHYLETGNLEKVRAISPFFIPDENDVSAMEEFRGGKDRAIHESFTELEELLRRIIHHDPTGFENRYHLLDSHKAKTELLIGSFTKALSDGITVEIVRLGGELRNVFRRELFTTDNPLTRVQFIFLDEDVERLVYLHLSNYINLLEDDPVSRIQELSSIMGDLVNQLGNYGLISANTADLCSHIRGGRDKIYVSQIRDLARMVIDNHHQWAYVFLEQYHTIGMAITNKKSLKVDQFIGALMRRRELDLNLSVQIADVLMKATNSFLGENDDRPLFGNAEPENGEPKPLFFSKGTGLSEENSLAEGRAFYGSKGSNLAILGATGVPVPEGFVLPATLGLMRAELGPDAFNRWLDKNLTKWIKRLESSVDGNLRFGSSSRPLLLSVRSGSAISMPGMMSTIPNVGINDSIVEGLAKQKKNRWFAYDTYRLFLRDFAVTTWGMNPEVFNDVIPLVRVKQKVPTKSMLSPNDMKDVVKEYKEIIARAGHKKELNALLEDPKLALIISINTVLDSWESGPAQIYRDREGLSHQWGTGVIVQRMRFGNLIDPEKGPSMTGVLFTRDVHNARLGINGEYVVGAQGNDIVGGMAGHSSIHSIPDEMGKNFPIFLDELMRYALIADRIFRANQDIEFTVETGALSILQSRDKHYESESARRLDSTDHQPIAMGVGVAGGGYRGIVGFIDSDLTTLGRRVASINGTLGKARVDGIILFVHAPGSKEVNTMLQDAVGGWAVAGGGLTSHAALMAKEHGIHSVFGLTYEVDFENRWVVIKGIGGDKVFREGDVVSIDGSPHAGGVYRGSVPFKRDEWQGEGEPHGGVWPWLRALFAQVGVSGKNYDRWVAWGTENALSQVLLGPLLATTVGTLAPWFGFHLELFSDFNYGWAAFFLAHFAQLLWGQSSPSKSTIFSAGLLVLVGVCLQLEPLSFLGLAMHFGLNILMDLIKSKSWRKWIGVNKTKFHGDEAAERFRKANLPLKNLPIHVSAVALPYKNDNNRDSLRSVLRRYLLGKAAAPVGFDVSMNVNSRGEDLETLQGMARSLGISSEVPNEAVFMGQLLSLLGGDESVRGAGLDHAVETLESISMGQSDMKGPSQGEISIAKAVRMAKRRVGQFAVLDVQGRVSQRDSFVREVQPLLALLHHFGRSFLIEAGVIGMKNVAEGQSMDMAFVLNLAFGENVEGLNQDQIKVYNQSRERAIQWGLDTRTQSFAQALKENRPVVVNISEVFENEKHGFTGDRAVLLAKLKATLLDLKRAMDQNPESQSLVGLTVRDTGVTDETIKALADQELKGLIEQLRGPGYNVRFLVGLEVIDSIAGKLSVRQVAKSLGSQVMPVIYTIDEKDWMDLQYALIKILLSAGLVRNATADILDDSIKMQFIKLQA
ncbi:MAG: hypothetical protein IPN90_04570 [Elusimicrobia bacterium]|nr:hypothetical protein [Elusimicrobiota bacterium]